MKRDLAAQMSKYAANGRRIASTKTDIETVTKEIEEQEGSLSKAQIALTERAVQLYRTDRLGMMEVLFSAESVPQLMNRMNYLAAANRHDARLIGEVRLERQENLWLHESLTERVDLLTELQAEADQQRSRIESDLAQQQERLAIIGADIDRLILEETVVGTSTAGAPKGSYRADTVISDARFRAASSMTVADIQAFLEDQTGSLSYYRAPDHAGVTKSAAEMIADASVAWGVSPQVVLATLQKEQSLLSKSNPSARALAWAMGCGKLDGGRTLSKYYGFGNQIWYGTKSLHKNAERWSPGVSLAIDGNKLTPSNASTHGLYKYTPHVRGNMSFWMIFWRYFGDPTARPAAADSAVGS